MSTLKKLFIATISVLLLTLGMNNTAYASEIAYTKDVAIDDTYPQELENSETEDYNIEEKNDEVDNLNEYKEIPDPEKYEIYYDEQGQVYYVEKEPEEIETIESDEIEKQEEKSESDKDSKPSYSENDLRLLACLVYSEAGNQPYEGMLAVANVVLNRVKSKSFSHVNTIEEVIYDNKWAVQFTVTVSKSGKSVFEKALEAYDTGKFPGRNTEAAKKSMELAIKAAKAALNGENNIGDFLCFRMYGSSAASIKKKYEYKIIGDHIFYRTK